MRLAAWNSTWRSIARSRACWRPSRTSVRLRARGADRRIEGEPIWIGENPHKGLAVFAFNGYAARLCEH